jgi:pyruvate dehydrogenase E1 component alpha subunit/2-oxoisovalerate dehydrogenase E1 component alpha subunit
VPLVLVVSNNHWAYSTPNDREFACRNLVDRARGYGYEGHKLDGTDLAACLDLIGRAVQRARTGGPPQLVVASLLRLAGHGEHDDASYVPAPMKKKPWAADCLLKTEKLILEKSWLDPETLKQWRAEISAEVETAVATAQSEAAPASSEEDWCAISTRELMDTIS